MGARRKPPAAAVGGLSSPVSLDKTFKRARKREREHSTEGGTYQTDGISVARPLVAGEPALMA